jgi:hypothetical protein
LLDGDVFQDDLYRKGQEGGAKAAELLHVAISQKLRSLGLDDSCRIMVRMYADLLTLSRAGMKSKVCGGDARALARFYAGFNGFDELFDFTDAGVSSDSVYAKIRATLNVSIDNPQCRHIFLGSTTRPELIDELHQRHRHSITLLQSHSFHHDFANLGLRVERIPNVFRSAPFGEEEPESSPTPRSESSFTKAHQSTPSAATVITTTTFTSESEKPCFYHFSKGFCKLGDACKRSHKSTSTSNDTSQNSKNRSLDSDWRSDRSTVTIDGTSGKPDFALELPHDDHMPTDQVPVNAEDYRLDSYILPPSSEDRQAFANRIAKRKLCNQMHLFGDCPDRNCVYDHWPISEGMRACLKEAARMSPCPRRGKCRLATCFFGHICQNAKCYVNQNRPWCKLPAIAHNTLVEVDRWESAVPRDGSHVHKATAAAAAAAPAAATNTLDILRTAESRSTSNASPALIDDTVSGEENDEDSIFDHADLPVWGTASLSPAFDEEILAEKAQVEATLLKKAIDAAAEEQQLSHEEQSPQATQGYDEELNTASIYGKPVSLMEW